MKYSGISGLLALSRAYILIALIAAIVFMPLIAIPMLLLILALYLYIEYENQEARYKVVLSLFIAISLPLLYKPIVGVWLSPLFTLPIIPLFDHHLRELGSSITSIHIQASEGLKPSSVCYFLAVSLLATGLIALALSVWYLAISTALLAVYLSTIIGLIINKTSRIPCQAELVTHKVIAGDIAHIPVRLTNLSWQGGQLLLESRHPWFRIRPDRLMLDRPTLEVTTHFTAPLAGPSTIECWGTFTDPYGLLQRRYKLALLNIFVIPRARYAEWLVKRYLEVSATGIVDTLSSPFSSKRHAFTRGTEYYGLRIFQPGDRPKLIDWKHTLKLQQVIVKEFLEAGVESAILMVNLTTTDDEEKDKLAYSIIATTLTLAREHISSAFAAYTDKGVVLTTHQLYPREALVQSLNLAKEIKVSAQPLRYLTIPDVVRLKGNISRLKQTNVGPASRLADLLNMEYLALRGTIGQSPATKAMNIVLNGVKSRANVIIISGLNHDAEAVAFNQYILKGKGYQVLPVDLNKMRENIPVPRGRLLA